MILYFIALVFGLALLVWSADRFVDGSASVARRLGMPPLLIGMIIVGFGTSAPELVVSALASLEGNPGVALGNAYGSNITNIALILGLTAIIAPIPVHSRVLRKELPILLTVTLLAAYQLYDGYLSRPDALVLLTVFALLMSWTLFQGLQKKGDSLGEEVKSDTEIAALSTGQGLFWMIVGLVLLLISSRILVWGAIEIARAFGVSDLLIGLTIVAVGTSLPELASSLLAIRKGEHEIALGNVIGSNLFNTLAVVGIAGSIHPLEVEPALFWRDISVMIALTLSLFFFGYGFRGMGRINRIEGGILLFSYIAYTSFLVVPVFYN